MKKCYVKKAVRTTRTVVMVLGNEEPITCESSKELITTFTELNSFYSRKNTALRTLLPIGAQ